MKKSRPLGTLTGCLLFSIVAASGTASAISITTGAGSAVSVIDRSATFDTITTDGIDISAYSEGMLDISTPGGLSDVGFTAFTSGAGTVLGFYYAGGNNDFTTITTSDSVEMFGLEFLIGHGFTGTLDTSVVWETYNNGNLQDSGQFNTTRGTVVGWSGTTGFDELRVGASTLGYANFGDAQAIAIDNLSVQLSAVPLPATIWLFGSGLLGLLGITRRRRSS